MKPQPLDFTNALEETKKRFREHPHWKMLDGTPWANDAPVITAELMRLAYARGLADASAAIRALAPIGHETDDDLPRGVAGAVGPDTTGPSEAMRNAD